MAIRLCSVLVGQPQSTGCRESEILEQDLWRAAMVRELQDRTGQDRDGKAEGAGLLHPK